MVTFLVNPPSCMLLEPANPRWPPQPASATQARATAARDASDRLNRALVAMAAKGLRAHCSDAESHWMWLSEDPAERARPRKCAAAAPATNRNGKNYYPTENLFDGLNLALINRAQQ
jgi:hypothetical protein